MLDERQDWESWHDRPARPTWLRPVLLGAVGAVAVLAALVGLRVFDGGERDVTADGVTIHVHTWALLFAEGFPDVLMSGVLAVEDGCVGLQDPDGTVWPVVWPQETSIASTDPLTLAFESGRQATVGATISGGGVEVSPDDVDVDVPQRCLPPAAVRSTEEGSGGVLRFNRTQPDGLDIRP